MAFNQVGFEFEAVEIGGNGAAEFAGENAAGFGKAFESARGNFAAFQNRAWGENFLESGDNLCFAFVHAKGRNLDDEHVFVFIDNQAAEKIALGVDHAERGGVWQVALPHGQSFADALLEEGFVDLDAFCRKDADVDF